MKLLLLLSIALMLLSCSSNQSMESEPNPSNGELSRVKSPDQLRVEQFLEGKSSLGLTGVHKISEYLFTKNGIDYFVEDRVADLCRNLRRSHQLRLVGLISVSGKADVMSVARIKSSFESGLAIKALTPMCADSLNAPSEQVAKRLSQSKYFVKYYAAGYVVTQDQQSLMFKVVDYKTLSNTGYGSEWFIGSGHFNGYSSNGNPKLSLWFLEGPSRLSDLDTLSLNQVESISEEIFYQKNKQSEETLRAIAHNEETYGFRLFSSPEFKDILEGRDPRLSRDNMIMALAGVYYELSQNCGSRRTSATRKITIFPPPVPDEYKDANILEPQTWYWTPMIERITGGKSLPKFLKDNGIILGKSGYGLAALIPDGGLINEDYGDAERIGPARDTELFIKKFGCNSQYFNTFDTNFVKFYRAQN